MLVKDIMTKGARTVTEDTSVQEVASLMCLYRFSGLPVVEGDKLIGFIAEKDVLAQLFPSVEDAMESMATIDLKDKVGEYKSTLSKKVSDLMTRGAKTVAPDMPVLKAAIIMANNRFRRIPVEENGKLVGMLSLGDIHKAIFHQSLTEG
ncbi:MAG TPA: CBS domain-containing protein [Thiolapillus brandeum]|uniref:CBS domain-containing protein n=1 Tax=Thiolapillus brandeum TaxID=1076588 RepID=A0A831RVS5_9GAMM|nr:CBS domain-containing protein [Thiolapillus brandeum]